MASRKATKAKKCFTFKVKKLFQASLKKQRVSDLNAQKSNKDMIGYGKYFIK